MKVFLGSSGSAESLDDLRKIAILIEEEGHTPVSWKKEGLFPLGNYMLDSLIEISKQVNAAVLIFNEDDPVWYRNEYVKQPRDNVSMEYTLFAATLGRGKTIICKRGRPKMPSDLQGLIYCSLDKEFRAESEIVMWLRSLNSDKIN